MSTKHKSSLQEKMYQELKEKEIFRLVQQYSMAYLDGIFERHVYPAPDALDQLGVFDEELPAASSGAHHVLDQLHTYGSPATTATLGGRYFGFVCGSVIPVGLASKSLGTFWDQAPAMHVLSPIAGKLESVVERWLVELFGLPKQTCAGFVSGTSMANLCGLAAARYRILRRKNWDVNEKGLRNSPPIRIIAGKQAHSTVLKAIAILGLGKESVEWVEVDSQGRIIAGQIPDLDEDSILILQAGNVNTGSFDDFKNICLKAQKAGAWVHIDGAFGLWAHAVKKLKHLTAGMEMAASWAIDGHKTLNTPYDCGIILCADQEALNAALHMTGSYIMTGAERDGMFFTPEMSRRARVIELWSIMKYLGRDGMDEMIHTMHLRARQFAEEIQQDRGFHVENEVVFNQVLVRCDTDSLTAQVLQNIQMLGECWLGSSSWLGKKVMRLSVCSWATTENDISRTVSSFKKALDLCVADSQSKQG